MAELQTYVAKVFIFVADAQALIDAGYDQVRVERRKTSGGAWESVSTMPPIVLEDGVYNYFFLDSASRAGWEYEPVLENSAVPGTPPDIRQGVTPAVDASYEQVMTVQELKDIYLYGLGDALSDDQGIPIPDRVYVHYIQAAIAKFEQKTSIRVLPTYFEDYYDYFRGDGFEFHLDEFPILQVDEVALCLPGEEPRPYPSDWIRLQKLMGQFHMVPTGSAFGVSPMPSLRCDMLPNAYRIKYFAGFSGKVPLNIADIIGKEASSGPLNLAGDLLGGAGIASQTISLDGLSTTFNTTSSATNAGFGARLGQYTKELKDMYPLVIKFYKGWRMVVA